MKVKPSAISAADAMQMMSDPAAAWAYYNPDMWDMVDQTLAHSPDSDSEGEHEDLLSNPNIFQGGTPASIAASMAMASGMPMPGPSGFNFENVDMSGPLSNSEKDVLNELVHELGIVSNQPQSTLQRQDSSTSKAAVIVTVKQNSDGVKPKASGSRIKKERPATPDLEDILAKPVKSQKPVDVDAVIERNRKNAIQARINRQKKKQQVDLLEDQIKQLEDDKDTLQQKCVKHEEEKHVLRQEIVYLRSVLANQSTLSGLLKNINQTEGVQLTSSGSLAGKRPAANHMNNDDGTLKKARFQAPATTAGVCLHVDKELVSLEFCEKCARMAKGGTTSQ